MKKISKFENVEYCESSKALYLVLSCILIFAVFFFILIKLLNPVFVFSISLLSAFIFYKSLKHKFVSISDFRLDDEKIDFGNRIIKLEDILHYRTEFINGAVLNIKLKSGKRINLSSNSYICKTIVFENFCESLEKRIDSLENLNIKRKKSAYESKAYFYFTIVFTIIAIVAFLFSIFSEKKMKFQTLGLILLGLSTMWAGILNRKNINSKKNIHRKSSNNLP
ncbi:hypothetical protein [Epilithonimonas caeni]|uniref:hypothetical protein n=1 Tax=Epilithonimonas caeni TaxID=365343 RepID=UPI0003FF7241|nr:hypothetical protein [Epilithonimonas caeni]